VVISDRELTEFEAGALLADSLQVQPEGLAALEQLVADLNVQATNLALSDGVSHANRFYIHPITRMDVPDISGMDNEQALDALYDARDATSEVVGYGVRVVSKPVAEVARAVRVAPRTRARIKARAANRAALLLRRPRARGAGRPAMRAANRRGDSGDSESESAEPPLCGGFRRDLNDFAGWWGW
jgi:hypothetical protein